MRIRERELERRISEIEAENTELRKARDLLAGRIALNWLGLFGASWKHSLTQKVATIHNYVAIARHHLQSSPDSNRIFSYLDLIDRIAAEILEIQTTPPLFSDEGLETFSVNELLRERIKERQETVIFSDVQVKLDLGPDDKIIIQAKPEWIRRGIDLLIDNSVDAMVSSPIKHLIINTSAIGNQIEISIEDTGPGMPVDVSAILFKQAIPQNKGGKGLGMGLILAKEIFQTYKGDLLLKRTDSHGTIFNILLPKAN